MAYIVKSADREIRLLFPEYFNEGLSVQRSMEDMEDDHRLVEDAILFIYFIYLEKQFKIDKSKLGRRNGTCATNTRRMFRVIFFIFLFVYSCIFFVYWCDSPCGCLCFEDLRVPPMQGKCIHRNSNVVYIYFIFLMF
jgi:hypothetical protein